MKPATEIRNLKRQVKELRQLCEMANVPLLLIYMPEIALRNQAAKAMEPEVKKIKTVSRSVFQKVCEEKKRLLNDIRILTEQAKYPNFHKIEVIKKWREKFEQNKEFTKLLREAILSQKPEIGTH